MRVRSARFYVRVYACGGATGVSGSRCGSTSNCCKATTTTTTTTLQALGPNSCALTPCSPPAATQCWVVESYQLRTCVRDDRKCLQGECNTVTDSLLLLLLAAAAASCCCAPVPNSSCIVPHMFHRVRVQRDAWPDASLRQRVIPLHQESAPPPSFSLAAADALTFCTVVLLDLVVNPSSHFTGFGVLHQRRPAAPLKALLTSPHTPTPNPTP